RHGGQAPSLARVMNKGAVFDRLLLPAIGIAIVLAVWQGMITWYGLARIVLPTPLEVVNTLWKLSGSPAFWRDVWVSLKEFFLGYAIGCVLGVATGLLIGESRNARMALGPVIEALRFIVPFA